MGRAVWDAYELYLCRSRLIWFLRVLKVILASFFLGALNGGCFGYLGIWISGFGYRWITVLSGFGFLWLISTLSTHLSISMAFYPSTFFLSLFWFYGGEESSFFPALSVRLSI